MKDQKMTKRLTGLLPWVALLLAAGLAVATVVPPRPLSSGALGSADFSVDNALELVEQIAVEPRPIGSPGNQRGREKIAAQLRFIGLEPEFQTFAVPNYFSRQGEPIELENVLARIPGTASTAAIALMGHHDTDVRTLGANDDTGAAVAVMLETARAILAGPPLRNDVILLFTDGEEPAPRFGSTAFVDSHPWFSDIGFVINLEAIGSGGPSIVTGMNGPGGWMIDQYAQAVPYPAASSVVTAIVELIGGSNTDLATFREANVPGIEMAYMTGSPIYHTMADNPDNVSARSLHQQGSNTLALVRHIGNMDFNLPETEANAIFFTIGRFLVVRYPTSWALPIVLLTGLLLAIAAWRQRGWLQVLRGTGGALSSALLSMVAAIGIWTLIGNWRSTMGIAESYLYLLGFVGLAGVIGSVMARLTRRRLGTGPDAFGVVALWWVLGLLTTVVASGTSYLFVWPALAGGLALLGKSPEISRRWWGFARWTVVTVTTLVVLVPAIDFFYQFAQPRPGNLDSQILAVIAIPMLFVSLAVELLRVIRVRFTHEADPSGC